MGWGMKKRGPPSTTFPRKRSKLSPCSIELDIDSIFTLAATRVSSTILVDYFSGLVVMHRQPSNTPRSRTYFSPTGTRFRSIVWMVLLREWLMWQARLLVPVHHLVVVIKL